MLNKIYQMNDDSDFGNYIAPQDEGMIISPADILAALRRQLRIIFLSMGICFCFAFLFLLQSKSYYTSSTSVLIDAKQVGLTATSSIEASMTFENGAVDSQLQILNSDNLAIQVAKKLGLQNERAFLKPSGAPIGNIVGSVFSGLGSVIRFVTRAAPAPDLMDLPESLRLDIAAQILQHNLKVTRLQRTYAFQIDYTDQNPHFAQTVAAQYASAYLEDQLNSKFEATRRASSWMEERIRDLKAQSLAADSAVQKYRADNNLYQASGRLTDDQSLSDATTQLTSAKLALDAASAKYKRLQQIIDSKDVSGNLSDTLENANVSQLRAKYLSSAKLESDITSRYGPNHQAAMKARKDMEEYKRLIFNELVNLLPAFQSDVQIAQSRVDSLNRSIGDLRKTNVLNDNAMVKLAALTQEADTVKTLYANFLQKYQEMQQQQSFPVTDARVISDASLPMKASSPKGLLILVSGLFLGGLIGAGLAFYREWQDRGFRTAAQVREELGLEWIANVPKIIASTGDIKRRLQNADGVQPLVPLGEDTRFTHATDVVLQQSVIEPHGAFAEAIRAIRFKAISEIRGDGCKMIGMISMFPDEGKSTLSKNLASSFAMQGHKTLLIDGDTRNPSLTRALLQTNRFGFVDIVRKKAALKDVIAYEEETGLSFLPTSSLVESAGDLFAQKLWLDFLQHLRNYYDVIILDLPPVGALNDAMAASQFIDAYVMVTQWGATPRTVVKDFLQSHPWIAKKIMGLVLNKVDMKRIHFYDGNYMKTSYTKYFPHN